MGYQLLYWRYLGLLLASPQQGDPGPKAALLLSRYLQRSLSLDPPGLAATTTLPLCSHLAVPYVGRGPPSDHHGPVESSQDNANGQALGCWTPGAPRPVAHMSFSANHNRLAGRHVEKVKLKAIQRHA